MKRIIITLLMLTLLTAIAWFTHSHTGKRIQSFYGSKNQKSYLLVSNKEKALTQKAKDARAFIQSSLYNHSFCFLIDMSLPSGQNRFFVYDLQKDSVIHSGLVTHGRCNKEWLEGRRYENRIGGGCTSLGKYKIGFPYYGRFGSAFKLHGLDKTNNNAYARYVVLHAHDCVPESETTDEICQSDGCPTVSPPFLQKLSPLIKQSKQPVLLWIFNE